MKEDPRCIRTDFIPQPYSSYENLPSALIDGNCLPFPVLGFLQMEKTTREINVFPFEVELFSVTTVGTYD